MSEFDLKAQSNQVGSVFFGNIYHKSTETKNETLALTYRFKRDTKSFERQLFTNPLHNIPYTSLLTTQTQNKLGTIYQTSSMHQITLQFKTFGPNTKKVKRSKSPAKIVEDVYRYGVMMYSCPCAPIAVARSRVPWIVRHRSVRGCDAHSLHLSSRTFITRNCQHWCAFFTTILVLPVHWRIAP